MYGRYILRVAALVRVLLLCEFCEDFSLYCNLDFKVPKSFHEWSFCWDERSLAVRRRGSDLVDVVGFGVGSRTEL